MSAPATPTAAPRELVLASAGSGKTYHLSSRIIMLLAAGAPTDEVLASTFTRKAAGEILERVLVRIAEGALDAGKAQELGPRRLPGSRRARRVPPAPGAPAQRVAPAETWELSTPSSPGWPEASSRKWGLRPAGPSPICRPTSGCEPKRCRRPSPVPTERSWWNCSACSTRGRQTAGPRCPVRSGRRPGPHPDGRWTRTPSTPGARTSA